ncbi:MAG: M23 family metallopeptidase [Dehalobacterium sp.]
MPVKIKKDPGYPQIYSVGRRLRRKWVWQFAVSFWACVIIWVLIGSSSPLGVMVRNFITSSLSPQYDWMPAIEEVLSLGAGNASTYEQMVLPVSGIVVQNFGWSSDANKEQVWHGGIDINGQKSQPVKAAAAGIVQGISGNAAEGYQVIIKHSQELISIYGGLAGITVEKNQQIRQGEKIGETGKQEVHFEIRVKGTPVDPLNYLRSNRTDV